MSSGQTARASVDGRLMLQMVESIWSLRLLILFSTPVLAVSLAMRGHPGAGLGWFAVAFTATVVGLRLVDHIRHSDDPIALERPMAMFTGATTTMWSVPALFFGTETAANALYTFLPLVVVVGSASVLFAARPRTFAASAIPVTVVFVACAVRAGSAQLLATLPGYVIALSVFSVQASWSSRSLRAHLLARDEAHELAASLRIEQQAALAAHETMRQHAERDPLTGAFNRRYLTTFVERLATDGVRELRHLAMIDLDHFKDTNDNLGHAAGDLVLQELVRCMGTALEPGSVVARWGGEEFVVLLPGTTSEVVAAVAHLRAEFAERAPAGGSTFSAGLVAWPRDVSFDAALRLADGALYRAKHDGRDRVVVQAGGSLRTIGGEEVGPVVSGR